MGISVLHIEEERKGREEKTDMTGTMAHIALSRDTHSPSSLS